MRDGELRVGSNLAALPTRSFSIMTRIGENSAVSLAGSIRDPALAGRLLFEEMHIVGSPSLSPSRYRAQQRTCFSRLSPSRRAEGSRRVRSERRWPTPVPVPSKPASAPSCPPSSAAASDPRRSKEGDRVRRKASCSSKLWNDDQQAKTRRWPRPRSNWRAAATEACIAAINAENEAERIARSAQARALLSISREDRPRRGRSPPAVTTTAKADVAPGRGWSPRVEQGRTVLLRAVRRHRSRRSSAKSANTDAIVPGVPTPARHRPDDQSCLYVRAPMDESMRRNPRGQPVARLGRPSPSHRLKAAGASASRPMSGGREAGTHGRYRGRFRAPGRNQGLLVGYSADVEIVLDTRPRQRAARPHRGASRGGRVLVTADSGKVCRTQGQDRPRQLGIHRIAEGLAAANASSPRSNGRRRKPVSRSDGGKTERSRQPLAADRTGWSIERRLSASATAVHLATAGGLTRIDGREYIAR